MPCNRIATPATGRPFPVARPFGVERCWKRGPGGDRAPGQFLRLSHPHAPRSVARSHELGLRLRHLRRPTAALGNGDGCLLYPPRRDPNKATAPCLDASINSSRWVILRGGIEDYE